MKKVLNGLAAAALIMGAATLQAQDKDGFVLSAGLVTPQGDAQILTQKTMRGYGFEVGYIIHPEGYGTAFHAYLGHVIIGGKDVPNVTTYDMAANTGGIDLLYRLDGTPLDLFTGPSFHQWQVNQRGGDPLIAAQGDENWKLGWRLGLKYTITQDWSVSASFTQSMWRSRADLNAQDGLNPSRPAYFSFMANYRF